MENIRKLPCRPRGRLRFSDNLKFIHQANSYHIRIIILNKKNQQTVRNREYMLSKTTILLDFKCTGLNQKSKGNYSPFKEKLKQVSGNSPKNNLMSREPGLVLFFETESTMYSKSDWNLQ